MTKNISHGTKMGEEPAKVYYYEIRENRLILYRRKTLDELTTDEGTLEFIGQGLIKGEHEANTINKCLKELISFPVEKPESYKAYQLIQNNIPIIQEEQK